MARIRTLESRLSQMKLELRTMCDHVLAGLDGIISHLDHNSPESLLRIVVLDSEIDHLEKELDSTILRIHATHQPLGRDLRLAFACTKIAHQIERMGDAVESLARILASRAEPLHVELIRQMLVNARDLVERSYKAMFENDMGQISDIQALDDKVDHAQSEVILIAKDMLQESSGNRQQIESALQLINISARIEKIADLACNWAEQIDFEAHGENRKILPRRKPRVVCVDSNGGETASLVGTLLSHFLGDMADIRIATSSLPSGETPFAGLAHAETLRPFEVAPRSFPVVEIERVRWNRTFACILLGEDLDLERLDNCIPWKTARLHWEKMGIGSRDERPHEKDILKLVTKCRSLADTLARNHVINGAPEGEESQVEQNGQGSG